MLLATQVGDLFVDGRSSRKGYTEIFVAQFVTLSQVELPVAKTTQKIFQKFSFKCSGDWPWRLSRDLIQSQKSRVLCKNGQFLNLFSFPQTFFTVHLLPYLKHSQTHCVTLDQTSIFASFQPQIFKRKVWVFSLQLNISCFELCFLGFVSRY